MTVFYGGIMKTSTGRIIIASAIFLMAISVCGAEGITHVPVELRLTEDLTISEIETDVFLVNHSYPWPANSLLVRLDDDMLWIDTPSITFDINREQSIILGGQEIIVLYPGPNHTFDNLTVYIPGRKLLFGGCMLLAAGTDKVGYAGDGDLREWVKSLSVLAGRFVDPDLVVPGHGKPGDMRLIDHTIEVVNSALR